MTAPRYKNFLSTKAVRVPKEILDDLVVLIEVLDDYKGKKEDDADALPPSEFIQELIEKITTSN